MVGDRLSSARSGLVRHGRGSIWGGGLQKKMKVSSTTGCWCHFNVLPPPEDTSHTRKCSSSSGPPVHISSCGQRCTTHIEERVYFGTPSFAQRQATHRCHIVHSLGKTLKLHRRRRNVVVINNNNYMSCICSQFVASLYPLMLSLVSRCRTRIDSYQIKNIELPIVTDIKPEGRTQWHFPCCSRSVDEREQGKSQQIKNRTRGISSYRSPTAVHMCCSWARRGGVRYFGQGRITQLFSLSAVTRDLRTRSSELWLYVVNQQSVISSVIVQLASDGLC